ncbi:MAG: C-terminal target protein [Chlorobi bacterium]|nr:C-terminal target protein [Chlorobiota bacterium]
MNLSTPGSLYTRLTLSRRFKVGALLTFLGLILFYANLMSHVAGESNVTTTGCTCHGATASGTVAVGITSATGGFVFDQNGTYNFTATVADLGVPVTAFGAGIDIGFKKITLDTVGTLIPVTGLKLMSTPAPPPPPASPPRSELVHSAIVPMVAGRSTFQFSWIAPRMPGNYQLLASGLAINNDGQTTGDRWAVMNAIPITVNGVALLAPLGGESWCAGTNHDISWNSLGVTTLNVELSTDGGGTWTSVNNTVPAAPGTWSWLVPTNINSTTCRLRLTDVANGAHTDVTNNFTITSGPVITQQPQTMGACIGDTVTFSVTASGPSLTYQWQKDGANILIAGKSRTYTINGVTGTDYGTYDVLVTGPCGGTFSNNVTLTPSLLPRITDQPVSLTGCSGAELAFTVGAAGTNLSYQWYKGSTPIPNATASRYLTSALAANEGTYHVVVSGSCNPPSVSRDVTLTVGKPPAITRQPARQTICEGSPLSLSVNATGSGLTYRWRRNRGPIDSATSSTYLIPSARLADAGSYDVVISGTCPPDVISEPVAVTVSPRSVILADPFDQTAIEGSDVTFNISADGSALRYKWRHNGIPITGATDPQIVLHAVKSTDAGRYDCIITGDCGSDTSAVANLKVNPPGSGPAFVFSPSPVNFGAVQINVPREINFDGLIRNGGDDTLKVTSMSISGTNAFDFTLVAGNTPFALPPGGMHSVTIKFKPVSTGPRFASLDFVSNVPNAPSLALQGNGALSAVSLVPSVMSIGPVKLGASLDTMLTICNGGSDPVTISSITIQGSEFKLVTSANLPVLVKPDSCISITIRFTPLHDGSASGTLTFIDSKGNPGTVILNGLARGKASAPSLSLSAVSSLEVSPNPTRDRSLIVMRLARPSLLDLRIVDLEGRTVRSLMKIDAEAGLQTLDWDGRGDDGALCASGKYRVMVRAGDAVITAPIVIVR